MTNLVNKNLKILVTEDEAINRLYITTVLSRKGWIVDEATNGLEAIRLCEKNSYDIILMDISMPDLNGIEATKRIREKEEGETHLPIIALTAHAFPSDRKNFLEAGMDDVIVKPLSEETLMKTISKYMD